MIGNGLIQSASQPVGPSDYLTSWKATSHSGLSNSRLGMLLLIGTETMLFSSFIGAYLVLRFSARMWPPFGAPALTLGFSSANTALLIGSSILAAQLRRWTNARPDFLRKGVQGMLALGVLFLGAQACEFYRLYERGMTLQNGVYGALFYSLITCHGLHVLGGLAIFSLLLKKIHLGAPATSLQQSAGDAELYWHFVTGVWLVLFGILYLW